VSRTQRNNKQQGPKERQKGSTKEDKTTKNTDFPKYFLRPLSGSSGPIPGFSPEFPAAGPEKIFPARGRRGPERAGENPKNHFNMAPAVSQFHGCCRIAPAYRFGTSKNFSLEDFARSSGFFKAKKGQKRTKPQGSNKNGLLRNMFY